MLPSPISKLSLEGKSFYVKRDDLIDPFLAGNKYRKLYSLLQTPKDKYTKIISYGGTQSNAMLAIASICSKKDWEFIYYSKPVNLATVEGNLAQALELGMNHVEIDYENYRNFIASLQVDLDENTLLIDQGGANSLAKNGLEVLANEIRSEEFEFKGIVTPSGTGTTALFLALALPEYIVYTVACVGDTEYLKKQMQALHKIPENLVILEPSRKYHFAKVYPEFMDIYLKLKEAGIEFDLLYAPLMWKTLLENNLENILYVHSGGVSGNISMLKRYMKKGYKLEV